MSVTENEIKKVKKNLGIEIGTELETDTMTAKITAIFWNPDCHGVNIEIDSGQKIGAAKLGKMIDAGLIRKA